LGKEGVGTKGKEAEQDFLFIWGTIRTGRTKVLQASTRAVECGKTDKGGKLVSGKKETFLAVQHERVAWWAENEAGCDFPKKKEKGGSPPYTKIGA